MDKDFATDWTGFNWTLPETPFKAWDEEGFEVEVISYESRDNKVTKFMTKELGLYYCTELSISPIPKNLREFDTANFEWGDLEVDGVGEDDGSYDSSKHSMVDETFTFQVYNDNGEVISEFTATCRYYNENAGRRWENDIHRYIAPTKEERIEAELKRIFSELDGLLEDDFDKTLTSLQIYLRDKVVAMFK